MAAPRNAAEGGIATVWPAECFASTDDHAGRPPSVSGADRSPGMNGIVAAMQFPRVTVIEGPEDRT